VISKNTINPDYQYETIFKKEGSNRLRPEKLIQLGPERKMIIINNTTLKDEKPVGALARCQ
jgi:hypothetical protein